MGGPLKIAFLIVCATLVLWLFISNLGRVWKVICNSIFGMLALLVANLITSPFGFFIGINAATCLVCGFLGLPGFIMLILLKFIA
ncbi:MAG: pro-sigmaK processing inhibitor BofA family protein [Clostridia bacterium]|nr:pro-sigmaK processing inhibitor BofA family protein [Clostridia bacterium]MBR2972572.1 pro-sigmaK processing inhibitor BofA family protein [Clostridia bacterium]